jgi:hypothetical protein
LKWRNLDGIGAIPEGLNEDGDAVERKEIRATNPVGQTVEYLEGGLNGRARAEAEAKFRRSRKEEATVGKGEEGGKRGGSADEVADRTWNRRQSLAAVNCFHAVATFEEE